MKVVFLEDVAGGARTGDIKEVKNGYARNFLVPRGIALAATAPHIERAQSRARSEERRQAVLDAEARTIADRASSEPVVLHARVGETGRLYGSVTAADIAEALSARLGTEIDRRIIELGEPIRQTGDYTLRVRFTRNVSTDLQVKVEPQVETE